VSTMETAEQIVTIMECCSAAYQKRKTEKPTDEILCMLTDRCHRQLISDRIYKDKANPKTPIDRERERMASQKQLDYISDLGGDPLTIKTAKQASDEITRLRAK